MVRLSAVISLFVLAACGADGPPEPPSQAAQKPAVSISGEARLGVSTTIN